MAEGFSIVITTPKIELRGGFFSKFWEILDAKKKPYEDEIKRLLQDTARNDHDYTSQTGELRESTKAIGSFGIDKQITLYVDGTRLGPEVVDDQVVGYAKYIIEPQYFNDPFITEALQRNEPIIQNLVQDLYNDAIREFNNLP